MGFCEAELERMVGGDKQVFVRAFEWTEHLNYQRHSRGGALLSGINMPRDEVAS
jgi:hypothetical protein